MNNLAFILNEDFMNNIVNSNCKDYDATYKDCETIAEQLFDDIPKNATNKEIYKFLNDYLDKNEWFDLA